MEWHCLRLPWGLRFALIYSRRDGSYGSFALVLAFFILGCGLGMLQHPAASSADVAFYNASQAADTKSVQYITLTGKITGEPNLADRSQTLRVSAETIRLAGWHVAYLDQGRLAHNCTALP